MATRYPNHLDISLDLSSLANAMGNSFGMLEALSDNEYMDALMNVAHKDATEVFNTEAAAIAAAGGGLKHMFEWGTQGINTGRTNMAPNPESETARLWKNVMTGYAMNQVLTFIYKPSIALVPNPTKAKTGMDPATIALLRRHIFTWKAEVMETGAMVHIIPKDAKMLLIPIRKTDSFERPADMKRGYAMSKGPIDIIPGAGVAGNFTKFWGEFWLNQGISILNQSISRQVEEDFLLDSEPDTPGPLLPAGGEMFAAQVSKKAKKTRIKMGNRAKARRMK